MKTQIIPIFFKLILPLLISLPVCGIAQYQQMKKGENLYDNGDYDAAAREYRNISASANDLYADYNLGNALSMSGKHKEAIRQYKNVIDSSDNPSLRSNAFYNMGNNFLKLKKYKQSVEAYKNALRINPDDREIRQNYVYAKKLLKLKQQQQKKQQSGKNNDQNKQQNKKQQQQGNQQQNSEKQDKNKQQQEQNKQQQENKKENSQEKGNATSQQGKVQPKDKMNKLEAERILEMVKNRDEDVLKKVIRKKGGPTKSTKEW